MPLGVRVVFHKDLKEDFESLLDRQGSLKAAVCPFQVAFSQLPPQRAMVFSISLHGTWQVVNDAVFSPDGQKASSRMWHSAF